MYHFVQIEEIHSGNKKWYLEPSSEEQVLEHFKKVFKGIISEGVHDYVNHPDYHPSTDWRKAVDMCRSYLNGGNFLIDSIKLENEALQSRINQFRKGLKFYLPEGVACYLLDERFYRIINSIDKETFEYPNDNEWRFEDVKFSRWGDIQFLGIKGQHWYARIKGEDVRDKNGKMKWDTRAEAEDAARWFCNKKNLQAKISNN